MLYSIYIVSVFSVRKQSDRVTKCQTALFRLLALFYFLTVSALNGRNTYIIRGQPRGKGRINMIKMFVTGAVVSKGYNGAEAIKYSEKEATKFVRFRIGVSVYDKNCEKNRRYVNLNVKGFNYAAGRVKDMELDAGMYVNMLGRYDEETWDDQITHEKKSAPVLILDEIEYCYNGGNNRQNGGANESEAVNVYSGSGEAPATIGVNGGTPNANGGQNSAPPSSGSNNVQNNFTGFEGFGGMNPFFPQN